MLKDFKFKILTFILLNINCISVTKVVSKLETSRLDKELHSLNIEDISTAFFVSNFDTSKNLTFLTFENKKEKLLILEVRNLLTSNMPTLLHSSNIPTIFVTSLVSKLETSKEETERHNWNI